MSPKKKPKRSSRNPQESAFDKVMQAESLIETVYETNSPKRQAEIARKALELSQDCVRAWLVLGDLAPSSEESLALYEKAVEAGARLIGEQAFRDFVGQFWLFADTRPYMHARMQLAECLREMGRLDEAISHYREMLELNPNDNQGVRYRLLSLAMQTNRMEDVESLLQRFEEDYSPEWYYTRALLSFRKEGDSEQSRKLLQEAQQVNAHVPTFLTGTKPLPAELPSFYSPGEEDEAAGYASDYLRDWRDTPGAIPWVRRTLKVPLPVVQREKRRVPWKKVMQVLLQLPHSEETDWEVELFSMPPHPETGETGWAFLIVKAESGIPELMRTWDERPRDSELWELIIEAMRSPETGDPLRPRAIHVTRKTWRRLWKAKLDQLEIRCELQAELPQIQMVENQFETSISANADRWVEIPEEDDGLMNLPLELGEVWRGVIRKLPAWVQIGDEMCRPSVRLILDSQNDLVLSSDLLDHEPPEGWLWEGIRTAICRPGVGSPRRPEVIELPPEESHTDLAGRLEDIGIRSVINAETEKIDEIVDGLTQHLVGVSRKALMRTPGITPDRLGSFYAAADEFYREAPWKQIAGDTILRIESNDFTSGPWYAVVMGQQGVELGVALYEDLHLLEKILQGGMSEEETARHTSALSVSYGEIFDIAPEDYDAILQYDWPIAAEEAYPAILRVNPGLALRSPLAWEVELIEACLRALPDFIRGEERESTRTVSTATREITLHMVDQE